MKKYSKIVKFDKDYKPIHEVQISDSLPPGVYEVNMDMNKDIFFSSINSRHDDLIDLPNTEYDTVVKELDTFMKAETKALFEQHGFVYKRSSLLYGEPGTGKTSIINRVIQKVVSDNGIVLFSPNPAVLEETFKILDSIQPHTRVMIILEELDELIKRYESELLNLLDGEIQKNNVIFMATTNYIDKIPARIRRPGRFSSVIEVGFPSETTRRFYLKHKLNDLDADTLSLWANKTVDFSIDELKETVLAVTCLGYSLDDIIKRISANKTGKDYIDPEMEENDEDDDSNEHLRSLFRHRGRP